MPPVTPLYIGEAGPSLRLHAQSKTQVLGHVSIVRLPVCYRDSGTVAGVEGEIGGSVNFSRRQSMKIMMPVHRFKSSL
jgi:hypothetical protein